MKRLLTIAFVVLVTTIFTTSCASTKYGCPGANSKDGRVPGKFKA